MRIFEYMYMFLNSDGFALACLSQMGHVSLRWVFDQTCESPMKHVEIVEVPDQACLSLMGLR